MDSLISLFPACRSSHLYACTSPPGPRAAHPRDPYLCPPSPSLCPSVGSFAELAEGQPDMSSSVGGGCTGGGGADIASLLQKAKELDQLKKDQDDIVVEINKKVLTCKLLSSCC